MSYISTSMKKAFLHRGRDVTHHMVIQDDMFPSHDFLNIINKAIKLKPNNPICFYGRSKVMNQAVKKGVSFIKGNGFFSICSIIVPINIINKFINLCDFIFEDECKSSDNRFTIFANAYNIDCFEVVPSVVEHIGRNSLLGIRGKRKASVFINADAKEILNNDGFIEYEYNLKKCVGGLKKRFKNINNIKNLIN